MTIELNDLPTQLMELRYRIQAGDEVTLTDGGKVIGTIVPALPTKSTASRIPGFAKGSVPWIAPDFDAPMMLVPDPDFAKPESEVDVDR